MEAMDMKRLSFSACGSDGRQRCDFEGPWRVKLEENFVLLCFVLIN